MTKEFGTREDMVDLWKTLATGWELDMQQDPPVLIFERDGEQISTVVLEDEVLEDMLPALNSLFISPNAYATYWEVRYPESEAEGQQAPAVLSLMRKGALMASLPLTPELLDKLVPVLTQVHNPQPTESTKRRQRLWTWVRQHRIWSFLIALGLSPLVALVLYAVVLQGMQYFSRQF